MAVDTRCVACKRPELRAPLPAKPRRAAQGKVKGHKAKRRGAQKKVKRGHVHMTCSITEGKGGYTLTVVVKEGRSLLAMDYNGFSDPYVKLYLDPTGTHTKVGLGGTRRQLWWCTPSFLACLLACCR